MNKYHLTIQVPAINTQKIYKSDNYMKKPKSKILKELKEEINKHKISVNIKRNRLYRTFDGSILEKPKKDVR